MIREVKLIGRNRTIEMLVRQLMEQDCNATAKEIADIANVSETFVKRVQSDQCDAVVYVVKCAGFLKVGSTGFIKNRVRSLQTANPLPIELVKYMTFGESRVEYARWVEKNVHRMLRGFRVRNEWYPDCEEFWTRLNKHMNEFPNGNWISGWKVSE